MSYREDFPQPGTYDFECEATDEGKDVGEGGMAYRIEEKNNLFEVVEYLPEEPDTGITVEWAKTRQRAEEYIREYIAIEGSDEVNE